MATWTTIPDSSLEPGKPIRSIDTLALRDNPVAIAEGAAGAPKIDPFAAFAHNGAAGAVGTYAFANSSISTASDAAFGSTRAGSALSPTSASRAAVAVGADFSFQFITGAALTGTWRCMGTYDYSRALSSGSTWLGATLWLRIA